MVGCCGHLVLGVGVHHLLNRLPLLLRIFVSAQMFFDAADGFLSDLLFVSGGGFFPFFGVGVFDDVEGALIRLINSLILLLLLCRLFWLHFFWI